MLDKSVADEQLKDAEERLNRLAQMSQETIGQSGFSERHDVQFRMDGHHSNNWNTH